MTTEFPQTPDFTGVFEPVRTEANIRDLKVEGEIPASLRGAFVRVQPDPEYPPMLGDDIFFNGDGVVSSFRFAGGHVDFAQRYVKTERLLANRNARRSLLGLYRNRFTNDPELGELNTYSTANTNVVQYGSKLLALKEDSPPYELDPITLETIGIYDFEGQLTSTSFTAHPKVDPETGNFCALNYEARGDGSDDLAYYEFDASGNKVREIWVKSVYLGMIHDIAVTPNYVVMPINPVKADLERMRAGGRHFAWDPDQDLLTGVMRRDGDGSDLRWMRLPPGFPGHVQNAFEENGTLFCDVGIATGNIFPFFPTDDGYTTPPQEIRSLFTRVRMDMSSTEDIATSEILSDTAIEFGRIDERRAGLPYQYGFGIGMDFSHPYDAQTLGPPHPFFFNVLTKLDVQSKTLSAWNPGPQHSLQEPIYVPRSNDVPEGDGYVMAVVNDIAERSSSVVVLDAHAFEDGPIATIHSPIRLRMALHGNWIS